MRAIFYSTVDYRWDFLRWQYQALQHFVGNVELCVWNNAVASRGEIRDQVKSISGALGVRCLSVPNAVDERSSIAHTHALEWGWQNVVLQDRPDVAVLLDFDLMPLGSTSVEALLGGAKIAGHSQVRGRVHYLWPGLLAIDLQRVSDPERMSFAHGEVDGQRVDTGGRFAVYLSEYQPEVRLLSGTSRLTDLAPIPAVYRPRYEEAFGFEIYDRTWFHYGAGSNWNGASADVIERKNALFFELAASCLRGEEKLWP